MHEEKEKKKKELIENLIGHRANINKEIKYNDTIII